MKQTICIALAIGLSFGVLAAYGETHPPGYVDFGKLSDGGEDSVEINIQGTLLSIVSKIAQKSEPEAAEILKNLTHVRVNVLKLNDKNRADVENRVKTMRAQLQAEKWERIVSVQEKKQDVGVYVKTRGEESIEGIVVTVIDGGKEAVLINVVGDIKPEQLSTVADKLNIEPLKLASKHGTKQKQKP